MAIAFFLPLYQDPYVSQYLYISDKEVSATCTNHTLRTNFAADHPIEDAGRHLSAALLRHTNLASTAIEIIEQGKPWLIDGTITDCFYFGESKLRVTFEISHSELYGC